MKLITKEITKKGAYGERLEKTGNIFIGLTTEMRIKVDVLYKS
jgi:hypothetical protein